MRPNRLLILFLVLLIYKAGYAQNFPPEYLGLILQKISLNYAYPEEAYSKGWEGVVKVRFVLTPDGKVKNIDIAQSSGYPLLDDSAIAAVKNASPYPFPKNFSGNLELVLPIAYQRTDTGSPAPPPAKTAPQKTVTVSPAESGTPAAPVSDVQIPLALDKTLAPLYQEPAVNNPQEPALVTAELNRFIDIALKNNQPTRVAREEVELAQMKITEAKRNFFPGVKVTSYTTSGEVFKVDFEERETKLEINQPLFYGGRFGDTYNQAIVNYQITQKNYDRLKFDVTSKAETAYYNLIAAKTHIALKEEMLTEGRDLLGKIEKLGAMNMLIPLEVTSAQSWYKQMELMMDTLRQDLFMAELTFKQVLNTNDPVTVQSMMPESKPLQLDLIACQQAAVRSRPEVGLSKLLVKFGDYGQKIERNKSNSLTVDFTGSYGRYSGHFLTEPWRDASNWFIGFKATKPWGASTINGNYSNDHQEPRFGQFSGTDSETYSGELLLFDSYKRLTDKKRADIDLHRSLSDFNETIKTITFEVRDALNNYQKASFQLEAAQIEMQYRRNDLEVTKVRAMTGETNISSAMESLFHLSEAQTRYVQAMANCQIALATLKKACGYGLKL